MPELLTVKQAAEQLGVSIDQVRGFVQDGDLAYINIGRGKKRSTYRFTQADLDDFIERRRKRDVPPDLGGRGTRNVSGNALGFMAKRGLEGAARKGTLSITVRKRKKKREEP